LNNQEILIIAAARAAALLYARLDLFMFGMNLKSNPVFRLADTG